MNLHLNKTKSQDINLNRMANGISDTVATSPTRSPPDFDFNLPCRYFKSSFARSLSLNSAMSNHCRSLDYDMEGRGNRNNIFRDNENDIDLGNRTTSKTENNNNNNNKNNSSSCSSSRSSTSRNHCFSLPQRLSRASATTMSAATSTTSNESSNILPNNNNILTNNEVSTCLNSKSSNSGSNNNTNNSNHTNDSGKMHMMPNKRMSLATTGYNLELPQQQQQQPVPLTQFRTVSSNASLQFNKVINHKKQQPQHHQCISDNANTGDGNSNNNNHNNSQNKRKSIVWPKNDDDTTNEQDYALSDEAEDLEITAISMNGNELMMPATQHPRHSERQSNHHQQQQQQQQQHQQHQHHQHHQQKQQRDQRRSLYTTHEEAVNVEAVLLQNQVDTLQWQLKQVETSCEMYRVVMEEVARFLDRYHNQKQRQLLNRNNMEQITRSKSMHHVYGVGEGTEGGECDYEDGNDGYERPADCKHDSSVATRLKTRSSINLIDSTKQEPQNTKKPLSKKSKPSKGCVDDHLYELITPEKNYNDFKDYTWRRSPKKLRELNALCNESDMEEKLNQEAFRLSRTIQNLLNTSMQQPDLTQHRSSFSAIGLGHIRKESIPSTISTLNQSLMHNADMARHSTDSFTCQLDAVGTKGHANHATINVNSSTANTAEMMFLRSANMRDSRLSLRSSTDSSVHSTSSSSKLETDEEHSSFPPAPHVLSAPKAIPQFNSTTEDESGFSSISSFHDIGVPLSSTIISTRHSLPNAKSMVHDFLESPVSEPKVSESFDPNVDSRNSTLKSATFPPPSPAPKSLPNEVGVPLNDSTDFPPRWDSSSKTYRTFPTKFQQRFSTLSNDDSSTVLWV